MARVYLKPKKKAASNQIRAGVEERFQNSSDFVVRELLRGETRYRLYYLKSVCDENKIAEQIVSPFFLGAAEVEFQNYIQSFPVWKEEKESEESIEKLLNGYVLLMMEGRVLSIEMRKFESSAVSESSAENVVQGPQDALNENIDISLNLIRNRYRSPDLQVEGRSLGRLSGTKIALVYDKHLADEEVLAEFKKRIDELDIDTMLSAGLLHQKLTKERWSLFPTYMLTERPDRLVKNLSEGKIAILVEGTTWALVAPAVFYDFFAAMDDISQLRVVGTFMRLLRYIAMFITILLPPFYVAILSYTPELLRVQFALLIAGSRATVPYPSFIEIILMLLMMEFLTEASIRLPKTIGSTATTVGGLILGQAATEAGLVANVMIIVVSAVAISNFVIPVNSMMFAIRVIRYPLIIIASLFGLVGVVVGLLAIIIYLCNLRSFGKPYFKLFLEGTEKV